MAVAVETPAELRPRGLDPMLLLGAVIVVAAMITWLLPAGQFARVHNAHSGQTLVVAGSYARVARAPVGPWKMLLAVPKGLMEAGPVIFFVLFAGAMLTVIEGTGAMGNMLTHLVARFGHRPLLVLALAGMLFLVGGASDSMYEEILAFIPLLCLLMRSVGLDAVMAVGISLGTASVAATFSPANAFLLGVSQPIAELRLFSGFAYRSAFFVLALALWSGYLAWYVARKRVAVDNAAVAAGEAASESLSAGRWNARDVVVVLVLFGGMGVIVLGGVFLEWALGEFTAVFIAMSLLAGLIGGLGWRGTSAQMTQGFMRLVPACMLIGMARAISVVLAEGRVLDTIANALLSPLQHLPVGLSAVMAVLSQYALAVPIPSESGRAMASLPVLVPLADVLGMPRQVMVLAFQASVMFGCMIVPTAGPALAILSLARVPYGKWLRFMAVPMALLFVLSLVQVALAVKLGIQ